MDPIGPQKKPWQPDLTGVKHLYAGGPPALRPTTTRTIHVVNTQGLKKERVSALRAVLASLRDTAEFAGMFLLYWGALAFMQSLLGTWTRVDVDAGFLHYLAAIAGNMPGYLVQSMPIFLGGAYWLIPAYGIAALTVRIIIYKQRK